MRPISPAKPGAFDAPPSKGKAIVPGGAAPPRDAMDDDIPF